MVDDPSEYDELWRDLWWSAVLVGSIALLVVITSVVAALAS